MARLQDFQTVTPTSSDKLLVVQSQGQGLVPYGSKLDSANPTGTGKFSLNRTSGSVEGQHSVAAGYNCTASGGRSHAEGGNTIASGNYGSHAEGDSTIASGDESHAEGWKTIANHASQHVFGEYNIADTSTAASSSRGNYVEIVGKGTAENARSNARTLDWSGNEVLAGDLTIMGNKSVNDAITVQTPTDVTFTLGQSVNLTVEALNIRRLGKLNIINITFVTSAAISANTEILVGTFTNLLKNYGYVCGDIIAPNNSSLVGSAMVQTVNLNLYINPTVNLANSTKIATTLHLLSA